MPLDITDYEAGKYVIQLLQLHIMYPSASTINNKNNMVILL